MLERVGVVVAHLTLQFDAHGAALVSPHSLADFLHLLRPAGLSGLRLSCGALPAAVAAEARRFTALTALHLSAAALEESHVRPWLVALPRLEKLTCDGPLPAWLPAALAALPALSQLALHTTGNHQFPEELQLLTGLVTLTSLHLETSRSLPGAASALTGLTALRALTVVCSGRAWRLPALAEFAALQSYRLRTEGVKVRPSRVQGPGQSRSSAAGGLCCPALCCPALCFSGRPAPPTTSQHAVRLPAANPRHTN